MSNFSFNQINITDAADIMKVMENFDKVEELALTKEQKGIPKGLATLGVDGLVPLSQLPPQVDVQDATLEQKGIVQLENSVTSTSTTTASVPNAVKTAFDLAVSKKQSTTLVIGTTQSGYTQNDVNFLCDGTDDDVEINEAIQALPADGGKIVILEGTYNISASIDVNKPNVTIEGMGNSTVLLCSDILILSDALIFIKSDGCAVKDLVINGNTLNDGIYIDKSNNNVITNVGFYKHRRGLVLNFTKENIISGNRCLDSITQGITLFGSDSNVFDRNTCNNNVIGILLYKNCNANKIINNTCNKNAAYGIYVFNEATGDSSSHNIINKNTCSNNSEHGIYLRNGCHHTSISGNKCYSNSQYGIYSTIDNYTTSTAYMTYISVIGNECSGNIIGIVTERISNFVVNDNISNENSSRGIQFNYCNKSTISGNIANKNMLQGIIIINSSEINIVGNSCNDNSSNNIELMGSSICTINGNTCNGSVSSNGIYLASGASNNNIVGNTCFSNKMYGISLYTTANNNNVVGNYYLNNIAGQISNGGTGNTINANKGTPT